MHIPAATQQTLPTTVVRLGSWTFQAEISRPEGGAALRALQFFADVVLVASVLQSSPPYHPLLLSRFLGGLLSVLSEFPSLCGYSGGGEIASGGLPCLCTARAVDVT